MSFGKAPAPPPAPEPPPPPPNPPMYGSEVVRKKGGGITSQPTFLGGSLAAQQQNLGQGSLLGF